VNGVNSSHQPG